MDLQWAEKGRAVSCLSFRKSRWQVGWGKGAPEEKGRREVDKMPGSVGGKEGGEVRVGGGPGLQMCGVQWVWGRQGWGVSQVPLLLLHAGGRSLTLTVCF